MRTLITAIVLCLLIEILLCSGYWITHTVYKQTNTRFSVVNAFSEEFTPGKIALDNKTKPSLHTARPSFRGNYYKNINSKTAVNRISKSLHTKNM